MNNMAITEDQSSYTISPFIKHIDFEDNNLNGTKPMSKRLKGKLDHSLNVLKNILLPYSEINIKLNDLTSEIKALLATRSFSDSLLYMLILQRYNIESKLKITLKGLTTQNECVTVEAINLVKYLKSLTYLSDYDGYIETIHPDKKESVISYNKNFSNKNPCLTIGVEVLTQHGDLVDVCYTNESIVNNQGLSRKTQVILLNKEHKSSLQVLLSGVEAIREIIKNNEYKNIQLVVGTNDIQKFKTIPQYLERFYEKLSVEGIHYGIGYTKHLDLYISKVEEVGVVSLKFINSPTVTKAKIVYNCLGRVNYLKGEEEKIRDYIKEHVYRKNSPNKPVIERNRGIKKEGETLCAKIYSEAKTKSGIIDLTLVDELKQDNLVSRVTGLISKVTGNEQPYDKTMYTKATKAVLTTKTMIQSITYLATLKSRGIEGHLRLRLYIGNKNTGNTTSSLKDIGNNLNMIGYGSTAISEIVGANNEIYIVYHYEKTVILMGVDVVTETGTLNIGKEVHGV